MPKSLLVVAKTARIFPSCQWSRKLTLFESFILHLRVISIKTKASHFSCHLNCNQSMNQNLKSKTETQNQTSMVSRRSAMCSVTSGSRTLSRRTDRFWWKASEFLSGFSFDCRRKLLTQAHDFFEKGWNRTGGLGTVPSRYHVEWLGFALTAYMCMFYVQLYRGSRFYGNGVFFGGGGGWCTRQGELAGGIGATLGWVRDKAAG